MLLYAETANAGTLIRWVDDYIGPGWWHRVKEPTPTEPHNTWCGLNITGDVRQGPLSLQSVEVCSNCTRMWYSASGDLAT